MEDLGETRNEADEIILNPGEQTLLCQPGRPVFEQGQPSNQAFYVEEGRLAVIVQEGDYTIQLAEIGPGEIFGEMGVLENEMRMATVKALEPTKMTVILRRDLEDRINAIEDKYIKSLINNLLSRLRTSGEQQIKNYTDLMDFQSRAAGLMKKAGNGIDPDKKAEFSKEVTPLLDQLEKLMDKYQK